MFICMDDDSIFVFVCAYVGPRGQEAKVVGESARQGPVRPLRVET
jgi:hypothetical protein